MAMTMTQKILAAQVGQNDPLLGVLPPYLDVFNASHKGTKGTETTEEYQW